MTRSIVHFCMSSSIDSLFSGSIKFFEGEDGKMWKRSVKDLGGEVLLVSQFTLYYRCCLLFIPTRIFSPRRACHGVSSLNCVDSCRYKGGNLDFSKSMPPQEAQEYYSVSTYLFASIEPAG